MKTIAVETAKDHEIETICKYNSVGYRVAEKTYTAHGTVRIVLYKEVSILDEIENNYVEKDKLKDAVYKDGVFVCPTCGASTFPLALHDGNYCLKCGQHVRWRGVIK